MAYGKVTVLPLAGQAPPLHSAEVISTDMDLYSNLSGPCIGEKVNFPGPHRTAPFLEASGLMGVTPSDACEHVRRVRGHGPAHLRRGVAGLRRPRCVSANGEESDRENCRLARHGCARIQTRRSVSSVDRVLTL